jgi:hypothetical protein
MSKSKHIGDEEESLLQDDEDLPDDRFVPLDELEEAEGCDLTSEVFTSNDSSETDFCPGCKEEFDLDDFCDECGECSACCVCHITEDDELLEVEKA